MSNQKRLKEYLVGENGYLKSDISSGKVIMLSGKWGSGKTHFWKNIIATDEFKAELNKKNSAYSYISLYGKSSIEEIENDIFGQIYFSAIGGENVVTKTFSTFTKYSKRYGNLFSTFDFSKLADGLEEEQKDNKERIALERLKNEAIICFDDFERKSKDIDLNDLFGFITQLALNFKCKIVIILNDDVFEGEEKKIFSSVKEKSVSKFLKYKPNIKDLFDSIFDTNERYIVLVEHKELILKTIEETEELNARIYIQVLDNLFEWISYKKPSSEKSIKFLILVNINFIKNHLILYSFFFPDKKGVKVLKESTDFQKGMETSLFLNCEIEIPKQINLVIDSGITNIENLINRINIRKDKESVATATTQIVDNRQQLNEFITYNKNLIESILFFRKLHSEELLEKYNKEESEIFNEISNFIKTGILIDE